MTDTTITYTPARPRRVVRSKARYEPSNNARTDWLLMAFSCVLSFMFLFVTYVAVEQHQAMRDMAKRSYQETLCWNTSGQLVTDPKDQFAVCEKVTIVRHKRDSLVLD